MISKTLFRYANLYLLPRAYPAMSLLPRQGALDFNRKKGFYCTSRRCDNSQLDFMVRIFT